MRFTGLILILVIFFSSCQSKRPNKFSDPILSKIADAQDKRLTDSLLLFLKDANPEYRKEAAMALASVQDSLAALLLGSVLLEDPDQQIRTSAAFALGQTGSFAAVNALIPAMGDKEPNVRREVLEALGKTIREADVQTLLEYNAVDSITQSGYAWAIYRLGLRGIEVKQAADKAAKLLSPDHSFSARLAAAHFFNRARDLDASPFADQIFRALKDKTPEVRMAASVSLRKVKHPNVYTEILSILDLEQDYRVKCNAIRSIQSLDTAQAQPLLKRSLLDPNELVRVAASEVIRTLGLPVLLDVIIAEPVWRVRVNLLDASASFPGVMKYIKGEYHVTTNNYYKAGLLSIIARVEADKSFIISELLNTKIYVVKSTAAQALVTSQRSNSDRAWTEKQFLPLYQQAVADGDPAVISIICSTLADKRWKFKDEIKDLQFLYDAKARLHLPRDFEAIQPLEETIAYLEGKEKPVVRNAFNHPIDWTRVREIPEDLKVIIQTGRGPIEIKLLVNEAPGSVLNFILLAEKGYFNGLFVHRVVPNFVFQAGCNRGDGYGSEDYSIRSEFSTRRYKTGSVGMASAGKDTEGTQWFITHSPTPHLDGAYSIFAEVVNGMEIVHSMAVGDEMLSVSFIAN